MIIIGWLGCWATRDEVVTQKPHKRKKTIFIPLQHYELPIIRKKNGSFVFRDTKRLISQYFVPKPKKHKEKTLQKRWPNKLLVKHCRVNGVSTANFIPSMKNWKIQFPRIPKIQKSKNSEIQYSRNLNIQKSRNSKYKNLEI